MTTVNFKRKKQALEFIINELEPMKEKVRELEQSVDQKFIETVGYNLGIYYGEQYGHDCLYTDKHKKAIIPNIKRTLLWDINYAINKHVKELEFNITYLEFVKKYGHMFDTYSDAIKAFHEFIDHGTTPTENIDNNEEKAQNVKEASVENWVENVETVESFDDETCKKQVDFLDAVQKDLEKYQNRQARKVQFQEEKMENNTEKVESPNDSIKKVNATTGGFDPVKKITEKVESKMNKFEQIKLQVEIINYTTDYVWYFEDLNEAVDTLENLRSKNESHEIGVSHFSVCGCDLTMSDENIEFIEKMDADTIIATVAYGENVHGIFCNMSLEELYDDMENNAVVSFYYGNDEVDAFEEYVDELDLLHNVPENIRYYIDYEKMLRDYTFEGLTVVELPYEGMERKYMFVNR